MSAAAAPACDYCGLPVPRPLWGAPAEEARPGYCCFGCRLAAAVTGARGAEGAATAALARLGLAIFLTLNVMVFTMALWTQDFYGADPAGEAAWIAPLRGVFRYLALLFALPVLLLLGGPLLANAWESLRRGAGTTDLLLVIGVAAAYAYSAASVVRDEGPVYFEVGCMVLVLVTLGRWLEATGKRRTTDVLTGLQRLLPETVWLERPGGEVQAPLAEVRHGDRVRVRPGARIPCDGVVLHRPVSVDEQLLTGESGAAVKEVGDPVHGGTLVLDGELHLEVTAPAGQGTLARLVEEVHKALRRKGHYERLADRVAAAFLPGVMLLALAAGAWHAYRTGPESGILTGLAVLVIACPCALGLATPLTVWAALGHAARAQVLFRNGEALEKLAGVRVFCFDKTGTLTTGTSDVAAFAVAEGTDRGEALRRAGQLTRASPHVHAAAIHRYVTGQGSVADEELLVKTQPGRGLTADVPGLGGPLYLGNVRLMEEVGLQTPADLVPVLARAQAEGQPLACLGWGGTVRGVFLLREELRPEVRPALACLAGLGLDVHVLTGDHAGRGAALGRELALPVETGLLPADKVATVQRHRAAAGPVAMVGDGLNDAAALAASDVGIALGCGADVTRTAAAVCLLGNELQRLPWAVALARRTVRVLRQNLFWAFAYNTVGIGLACAGRLNPVVAALAMVLSSQFVVANSLRLRAPDGPTVVEGPVP
jgi:heavy metal translocating P-type ATPase